MPTHHLIGQNPARTAEKAAAYIAERAREAIANHGYFAVALARRDIEWKRWEIFFAEERAVSTEDDLSVWHNVYETLLRRVPVREEKARPMFALGLDVASAAQEYAPLLAPLVGDPPRFDLVLLTLGRNGEMLGLHALAPALEDPLPVAAAPDPPMEPHVDRVTLTPVAIRHARHLLLVLYGGRHTRPLRMAFDDDDDRRRIPAQVLRDAEGEVALAIDEPLALSLGLPV